MTTSTKTNLIKIEIDLDFLKAFDDEYVVQTLQDEFRTQINIMLRKMIKEEVKANEAKIRSSIKKAVKTLADREVVLK